MKAMTLEQFGIITNFVQKHHKFSFIKYDEDIQLGLQDGLTEKLAKYGLNIKYVRCDYDTRYGTIWGICLGYHRFSSNMFVSKEKPADFKYDNLFDLSMAYLKGEFTEVEPYRIL